MNLAVPTPWLRQLAKVTAENQEPLRKNTFERGNYPRRYCRISADERILSASSTEPEPRRNLSNS